MRERRFEFDREQLGFAPALWLVAGLATLFALLATIELSDGDTGFLWGRLIRIQDEPALFAISIGLDVVLIAFAGLFNVAAVSATNQNWLPERLRHKPLPLLAFMCLLTVGLVLFGVELASGDITLSRHRLGGALGGHLTDDGTPIRYAVITLFYLFGWIAIGFGWFSTYNQWKNPPRPRWKPPLDDPSKRGSIH